MENYFIQVLTCILFFYPRYNHTNKTHTQTKDEMRRLCDIRCVTARHSHIHYVLHLKSEK